MQLKAGGLVDGSSQGVAYVGVQIKTKVSSASGISVMTDNT